ncbi:MAG: transporter [Bacteroidota bacterium]
MRALIFIFFILVISEGFAQGKIDGFYQEPGSGTTVLGFGFEDSKNYRAGRRKTDLGRSVYYVNLYANYGILENLSTSISIPYIVSDDQHNLQDITLLLKYRILQSEKKNSVFELSLAGGISTPLSNYDLGGLNDIGQQATVIESRAMAHYKKNNGWFMTLQSGYSLKLQEVPHSIPMTVKLGRATAQWYYDLFYDLQYTFGGIDYRGTPRPQNFREFGTDFHKIGGSVYTSFSDHFGGYISLTYTLAGRNVFVGAAYGLGVVYQFRTK